MTEERRGLAAGAAAFGLWGLFPLYWPLLDPATPLEVLAHRVGWSLVVMAVLVAVLRRGAALRAIWTDRRARLAMTAAGLVIAFNWFAFIWGVNNGHVVDVSLGYYINPLVTVLLGVVVLSERLRRWQWIALGIAFLAVLVLTYEVGRPPWVSLTLAFSFGTYGLLKKRAAVGPAEGLTYEALVLAPVALGYVGWLSYAGQATAWSHGPWHTLMLSTTGLVTALPLLCFAAAANRVSLSTLGLLQYIAPTMHFLLGWLFFGEDMPVIRWVGFSLVWLALAILTVESLVALRRRTSASRRDTWTGAEAVETGSVLDADCFPHEDEAPAETSQRVQAELR